MTAVRTAARKESVLGSSAQDSQYQGSQEHCVAEYLLLGWSTGPPLTRLRLPMLLRRRPAITTVLSGACGKSEDRLPDCTVLLRPWAGHHSRP